MPENTAEPGPVPAPDLEVIADMQGAILTGMESVQQAKALGKPVVWCSVLTPKEILHAMGVAVVYGELLGGYASIFGLSGKYCQFAERNGLSRDVCAVHRCSVGMAVCDSEERDEFFNNAFAPPDLVIGSNFPCMSESKSFLQVVRKYNVPYYFIDAPINTWGRQIPEHAIAYYAAQFQGLIDFLAEHGYPFDPQRLKEEVAFTKALNAILEEIEEYRRAVPSPMKAYDTIIATTTPLVLPEEMRNLALFEKLRDQLKERVARGIGIVDNEKLRLLWLGIPPLCDFHLLNYPEKHQAVVAKSMLEFLTGFTLDPELIDPEKPLESLARAQLASPANPLIQGSLDYFVQAVKDYRIDGVIAVVKRTCGLIPGMMRLTKEAIYRAAGVPAVVFDLDGVDQREYDREAAKANIDSFIETLMAREGN
jgi:benzoyl-CoA reductase subunit B